MHSLTPLSSPHYFLCAHIYIVYIYNLYSVYSITHKCVCIYIYYMQRIRYLQAIVVAFLQKWRQMFLHFVGSYFVFYSILCTSACNALGVNVHRTTPRWLTSHTKSCAVGRRVGKEFPFRIPSDPPQLTTRYGCDAAKFYEL